MEEALGALLSLLARGVSGERYRKADLDWVQEKNFVIQPKHGAAALDSSEFPASGCYNIGQQTN